MMGGSTNKPRAPHPTGVLLAIIASGTLAVATGSLIAGVGVGLLVWALGVWLSGRSEPRDLETPTPSGARVSDTDAASLRRLVERLDEPVLVVDRLGLIRVASAGCERVLGVGPLVGRALDDAVTHDELRTMMSTARAGGSIESRVRLTTPEGVRTYAATARPFAPEGGGLLALRDLTELIDAVEARSEFVAAASHELRTPISAIRAATETLELDPDPNPMRARLVAMVGAHAVRLQEMVDDLLDLTRLERGGMTPEIAPTTPEEIIAGLDDLFAGSLRERDLLLAFEIEPGLERVETDARLVRLILRNLIDNSTKFAREGSGIRVVLSRLGPRGLRLEVIDRGIGIPLADQARVFEAYYQVDQARTGSGRRGTGLGLTIVRQAARALGGDVSVRSVWKEGTTMVVELPGRDPSGRE